MDDPQSDIRFYSGVESRLESPQRRSWWLRWLPSMSV